MQPVSLALSWNLFKLALILANPKNKEWLDGVLLSHINNLLHINTNNTYQPRLTLVKHTDIRFSNKLVEIPFGMFMCKGLIETCIVIQQIIHAYCISFCTILKNRLSMIVSTNYFCWTKMTLHTMVKMFFFKNRSCVIMIYKKWANYTQ